jgi:hypothetical protein
LKKTAEHIYNGEYDAIRKVYDDACGNSRCIGDKLWMIDIDTNDDKILSTITSALNGLNSEPKVTLPTKNGFHVLCEPFPLNQWKQIQNVDVIKHCFTLLYIP